MKRKITMKILAGVLSAAMMMTMLTGCGGKKNDAGGGEAKNETGGSGDVITVDFWTAPEQYNLDFWSKYADKFNSSNAELDGKKIEVKVQMMPAQPSSEAGIQNAI